MQNLLSTARIEIIRSSALKGLNTMSRKSAEAISNALSTECKNVSIAVINSMEDLIELANRAPNLVFLGIKYLPVHPELGKWDPEKIWITDFLDNHGIAYTGSSSDAHKLEEDKTLAKQKILDAGLNTSPFYVIKQGHTKSIPTKMTYPFFVKPTNRGGGLGIDEKSVVHNEFQLLKKVDALADELQVDALVEEYLVGKEYSVAILRSPESGKLNAFPIELSSSKDSKGNSMLSNNVKSSDTENITELVPGKTKDKICKFAIDSFSALGGTSYGRIDIRCCGDAEPYFLEANLIPGLLEKTGYFPQACSKVANISYEEMIKTIAMLGLN